MYFSWVVVLFDYFFFLFLLGGEMQKVLVLFCSIPRLLMLLFLTGAETRVFRLSMHFSNAPLSQHCCPSMRETGAAVHSTLT